MYIHVHVHVYSLLLSGNNDTFLQALIFLYICSSDSETSPDRAKLNNICAMILNKCTVYLLHKSVDVRESVMRMFVCVCQVIDEISEDAGAMVVGALCAASVVEVGDTKVYKCVCICTCFYLYCVCRDCLYRYICI